MEVEERLPPYQYRYFVLYYVVYYLQDEETPDSFIPCFYLKYKKGPDLILPSPLSVATSLQYHRFNLSNSGSHQF